MNWNMNNKIKVLIVDDASFMVNALREILESDACIEVIGAAKNGQEALDKIRKLKPDVVTLDVDMPVMDGISAIRHIMIETPTPIVMLSSLFKHGDITFEALRLGVVDFLPKPSGAISRDIHQQASVITDRVKIAASQRIENVHRVKLTRVGARDRLVERYGFQELDCLIAIGTTLGGPNSIIRLLSQLSPQLPAAIVVVQEIAINILPEFAARFNDYTTWKIEVGAENTIIEPGTCYLCSYQTPMTVHTNQNNEPCLQANGNDAKPLNALFTSTADIFEQNTIGILLTGTGKDGEEGFAAIKRKLGTTIAQNSKTCVYPNLTQCAIEHGVVDVVTDIDQLCEQIEAAIVNKVSESHMLGT